jgi:DNA-binding MarR family transcriptional regulator
MNDRAWSENVSVPTLMRGARDVYRDAIGRALAETGCDDVPRNGTFVLAGLDRRAPEPAFSAQSDVVASLGLSKQTASHLIDTLVLRDYLERRIDPDDRRRMGVRLTARGLAAAAAIDGAIDEVEQALVQLIGSDRLRGLKADLAAFREMREPAG